MQDGKMRDVADIGGIPVYCRYDEAVDIDRVTGHPRNPNKHGDEQIALLAKIIKNSGWRNPICVSNRSGFVIKGHGRLMAARVLGVAQVPVEYQDYATEAEEYQDMIADNRIAELAERDMGIIKDLLEELDTGANDMDMTGYVEAEIERLMTQCHVEDETDAEPQTDRAAELNAEKWHVKTGDLWLIGDHRLLCGDSTNAADVGRLLGDRKPVLMVTDPPYGVQYEGGQVNERKREKLSGDESADLYGPSLALAAEHMPVGAWYVWHAGRCAAPVYAAIGGACFEIRALLIWNKMKPHYGAPSAHYCQKHEPCLYAVKGNAAFCGPSNECTVWDIDQPSRNEHHPTQKPLECMARPMRNHVASEVYDPFLGSGTTMVAGQNLGRKVYGLEISPNYCAVILQRMTDAFPGIKIRREE